jgi:hypothetical protein
MLNEVLTLLPLSGSGKIVLADSTPGKLFSRGSS